MANKNDKKKSAPFSRYIATQSKPDGMTLLVRDIAQRKMDAYVRLVNTEIGWMGFIKSYERVHEETGLRLPNVLILEDVFLYDQEVSGGSVDSGSSSKIPLGEVLEWAASDQCIYDPSELRFFGHSHVNMGAYHSGIDTGMIDDWAETGLDWCVSYVQNKKGETDPRFEMFTPFRISVPVDMYKVYDQDLENNILEEITDRVRERKYKSSWEWGGHNNNRTNVNMGWKRYSTEGEITLGDDPFAYIAEDIDPKHNGSVETPVIRKINMPIKFHKGNKTETADTNVRMEIVKGVIIHASIDESPSAKDRVRMLNAERWGYYNDFKRENPKVFDLMDAQEKADPTGGQLELSRSIQRSDHKRTNQDDKSNQDEQPQTQNQDGVKSDGKEGTKENETNKSAEGQKDKNEKKQGKTQLKEVTEKESITEDDTKLEEEIREGLREAGLEV